MSGFPNLVPAFSISMQTTEQLVSGQTFAGAINSVGPISTGTITSEPGFGQEPLKGTFVHGADVIRIDPTGKVAVLDFRSVISVSETENLFFTFTGYIEGNKETLPILTGRPDTKGYDWGSSCKSLFRSIPFQANVVADAVMKIFLSGSFETGCERYQSLTNKIFVGSQRVVKEDGKDFAVEIKLSLVGS